MAPLRASEAAFWSSYTAQIHALSVARTPFQTVSLRSSRKFASWGYACHSSVTRLLRAGNNGVPYGVSEHLKEEGCWMRVDERVVRGPRDGWGRGGDRSALPARAALAVKGLRGVGMCMAANA
jgi:hypothetical protein